MPRSGSDDERHTEGSGWLESFQKNSNRGASAARGPDYEEPETPSLPPTPAGRVEHRKKMARVFYGGLGGRSQSGEVRVRGERVVFGGWQLSWSTAESRGEMEEGDAPWRREEGWMIGEGTGEEESAPMMSCPDLETV